MDASNSTSRSVFSFSLDLMRLLSHLFPGYERNWYLGLEIVNHYLKVPFFKKKCKNTDDVLKEFKVRFLWIRNYKKNVEKKLKVVWVPDNYKWMKQLIGNWKYLFTLNSVTNENKYFYNI